MSVEREAARHLNAFHLSRREKMVGRNKYELDLETKGLERSRIVGKSGRLPSIAACVGLTNRP